MPKICLNMIVKNESKIIERLLLSVLPVIDSYCICDTGSTDNTIELIQIFFAANNVPGKIVNEPFRDFGYNRTYALKQCNNMENADYVLLLDADMILKITPDLNITEWKGSLIMDAYMLYQGSDTFFYKNTRLIKNNPETSYWGVTHEYVKLPPNHSHSMISREIIFVNDIGDGGSKVDKFERDVKLLLKGLMDEPNNDRYTFYLANSYRDATQYQNAIETYKKRIGLGGWKEEIWHSYYSIGNCYNKLNDMPNAVYYWLEAYQFMPERIENLYKIVSHYRQISKHVLANTFYELANAATGALVKAPDFLFLEKGIYDYKLDYEFTIFGYYCNPRQIDIGAKCMKVIMHPNVGADIIKNVLSNYKFYACMLKNLESKSKSVIDTNLQLLQQTGRTIKMDNKVFCSSTPSICLDKNNNQLIVNTRYVNYRIDEKGGYSKNENITTKNIISVIDINAPEWKQTKEFELGYDKSYDNLYVGVEDIRMLSNNGSLYYNANRGFQEKIMIENGTINLKSQQTMSSMVLIENQQKTEKNWVMFVESSIRTRPNMNSSSKIAISTIETVNIIKMIYGWYPLTIGIHGDHPDKLIDDKNKPLSYVQITHKIQTPPFFKNLRGSTNGVIIENEIWFICHAVSYEDRRYYYHIFVVLDSKTYQVKKYSKIFTFEKKKVEYTLGFVYFENSNDFLIGYSLMDNETKYMTISKTAVDELMYQTDSI